MMQLFLEAPLALGHFLHGLSGGTPAKQGLLGSGASMELRSQESVAAPLLALREALIGDDGILPARLLLRCTGKPQR